MVLDTLNTTHPSELFLSISLATTGAIGAPGNLFLMVLILSEYKKRKPHDWLFFLLALGDFFLCVNNAALQAPFILLPEGAGCKLTGAFMCIFGMISFLAPVFVAFNRYLSLYNNPLYQRLFTIRNVFIGWGVAVTICSLWITMFAAMDSVGKDTIGLCGLQRANSFLASVMAACCVLAVIAYAILVYFTIKVVLKIRQHKKTTSQSAVQSRLVSESRQIITALIFSFGVASFTLIPSVVTIMLQMFLIPVNPWVARGAGAAFQLTPSVNAYVTTYVVKEYRRKAIRIFKRHVEVAPAAAANPERRVGDTPV